MEFTFGRELHVDCFQDNFNVGAPVLDKENACEASFCQGTLDVVFCGNVDIFELRFLDVVDTQLLFSVLHRDLSVVGGRNVAAEAVQSCRKRKIYVSENVSKVVTTLLAS